MAMLSELRVVEGSAFVPGPLAGLTMAQLGADVIRFDMIGGGLDYQRWPITDDGVSLYWAGLNKGKRSVAIDLRRPEGKELATELIVAPGPGAGLFLTNFPAEGWLADDRLRSQRADLIYVNLVGNPDGSTAADCTIHAASGIPYASGPEHSDSPVIGALPAWDVAAGLHAVIAMLGAERERARTGEGEFVRISLADVAFSIVGNLGLLAQAQVLGENRPPLGNDLFGAFGRDFATSDGHRVMVAAISAGQWNALVRATAIAEPLTHLERAFAADFRDAGERFRARHAIAALIEPWCATRTLAEVRSTFDAQGVCWGPFQTFKELLTSDSRVSTQNPVFGDVDHPGIGSVRTPASPVLIKGAPPLPPAVAPLLGTHTDEVLGDVLGLSGTEIAKLHDAGVVAGPHPPAGMS